MIPARGPQTVCFFILYCVGVTGPGGGHTLGEGGKRFGMGFSHFGTPGKGSRLHGSAFQGFADFAVPCGKGFPDGEPGFPEGLPEKGRDLKGSGGRSKNNETPYANSVSGHGGGSK